MSTWNLFRKFILINVAFDLLLFIYSDVAMPVEHAKHTALIIHFLIVLIAVFIQLVILVVVLLKKPYREKICPDGWAKGITIAYLVLISIVFVLGFLIQYGFLWT